MLERQTRQLSTHTVYFFFNDTATTEIYTLSLHDALPILVKPGRMMFELEGVSRDVAEKAMALAAAKLSVKSKFVVRERSEEHTSELQSRQYLVCRLLLEKKNNHMLHITCAIITHSRCVNT